MYFTNSVFFWHRPQPILFSSVFLRLNFTLVTDLGDLDLFGEITGGGRYEDLLPHTIMLELFGTSCRCLGLKRLIEVKRAAGRPRDLEAVAELEALLEMKERQS